MLREKQAIRLEDKMLEQNGFDSTTLLVAQLTKSH
jgi:hypothetical protein